MSRVNQGKLAWTFSRHSPHPSFQGGDEITEIPSSELERPITEESKRQERQLDRRERDPGDRRDTAGQTEPQEIIQADHGTQITSSCEEGGRGSHLTLDLDGEVDMQGIGNRGQSTSPPPVWKIPENQHIQPNPNLQVQCQPTAQR